MAKLIFVAGTGRSGTHLVGRTIASHEDVQLRMETPLTFRLLTHIATHQDWAWGPRLAFEQKFLTWSYRLIGALAQKPFVLEKSHPSLWLAEPLLESLDQSLFVAVWREPEPTVASMLRHGGVLSWYKKLPANAENRFLGITKANKNRFATLRIEEKCALRWLSHKREIDRLNRKFPDRFMTVKYDDLIRNRERVLEEISSFLRVKNQYSPEDIKLASLDKWKTELSNEQIMMIRDTITRAESENF